MASAKDIIVKPIKSSVANEFVKKHHYSGKVVQNSQLHFGCFLNGVLGGVMQFGPSLDKKKIQGLVKNTRWNDFIELNRMAFSDLLPRNSESRCIAVAIRLIKKHYPNIKWIISFADGCQCGDGTIYRASGFVLTGLNKGSIFSNGKEKIQQASISARGTKANKEALKLQFKNGGGLMENYLKAHNMKRISGYSLRYLYFIDKEKQKDLTVPILPFSTIDKLGARMYKGVKYASLAQEQSGNIPVEDGGATPTNSLQNSES